MINKSADTFEKSLLSILLISYIQPFEDGNKRTARLIGNAMLLADMALVFATALSMEFYCFEKNT